MSDPRFTVGEVGPEIHGPQIEAGFIKVVKDSIVITRRRAALIAELVSVVLEAPELSLTEQQREDGKRIAAAYLREKGSQPPYDEDW